MKKLTLLGVLFLLSGNLLAQQHSDSVAYQAERKRINAMLVQRTQKFGQYDQSLSKRTGIFGLQTKKDIRNSNDILMDIVKTDNDIYKEIKILLDFRAFQQTQAQTKVQETENNDIGYMTAINKLRKQVDDLKAQADQNQHEAEKNMRMFIIALAVALIAVALLVFRTRGAA